MAKLTSRLSLMFLFDHQHMEALAANDCFCTFSISWKIYWKCLHTTDKELKSMQIFNGLNFFSQSKYVWAASKSAAFFFSKEDSTFHR